MRHFKGRLKFSPSQTKFVCELSLPNVYKARLLNLHTVFSGYSVMTKRGSIFFGFLTVVFLLTFSLLKCLLHKSLYLRAPDFFYRFETRYPL